MVPLATSDLKNAADRVVDREHTRHCRKGAEDFEAVVTRTGTLSIGSSGTVGIRSQHERQVFF